MNLTTTVATGCLLALCLGAACNSPDELSTDDNESTTQSLATGGDTTFIVTHLDMRKCIAPLCGGYFVQAVNRDRTPCADGSAAAECHAFRLDFGPSRIDPGRAAAFEQKFFASQHGLVRGKLVSRPLASGRAEDVLVVAQAWEGQALTAARGTFNKLTATGRLCITFPCDSFQGEKLNFGTLRFFNGVDLGASGASADAVARGRAAMNTSDGVLAAGVAVAIVGPAGRGHDFRASEFYLRVPPAGCGSGACNSDADCRTFSDYCTGCDCRALSTCEKDPVCAGPGVRCLVDPCFNQQPVCLAGRCTLSSAATN